MQCTACGAQNPPDARFCSQCGAPLGEPLDSTTTIHFGADDTSDRLLAPVDAEAAEAVEGLPVGNALLVVQRGPGAGSRFLLDREVVHAGRHPESEIFLDDITVSRRHAEFARVGETFSVSDVGSLNGTYVNRDRIDSVVLKNGDEVQIGKFRLVFYAGH